MEFTTDVLPFCQGTVNELFGAAGLLGGEHSDYLPPLGMDLIDRIGEHVGLKGVSTRATIVWQSKVEAFSHQEAVGEEWEYAYRGSVQIRDGGNWDTRTPILHPAVAAVDATQAGYDDAYLRAMQNVDILVSLQRDESRVAIRRMVERYSKLTYNPFRLLFRGAVLWAITSVVEKNKPGMSSYSVQGCSDPVRIGDVGGYAGVAHRQLDTVNDAAYIRCENAGELFMVEVMHAMCSSKCPIETDMTIGKIWPLLSSPYVLYTSAETLRFGTGKLDAYQIEATLRRFADIFDCHDLLKEALQAAQFFVCRPARAGVLAGAYNVNWMLPPSDLRVGAIGPLLAGISAEGMRTTPFPFPRASMFLYGAAVRACFITAGYYEALLKFDDTHPVAHSTLGATTLAKYRLLTMANSGRHFMEHSVAPIAKLAGWDCMGTALRYVYPRETAGYVRELFRAASVPWWTNVILHMHDSGSLFVQTWAKPARVVGMPTPNRWLSYQVLQGVTQHQLGAAVRWLGADVRYCIDEYGAQRRWMPIEVGSINRFIPNMCPVVRVGRELIGIAAVKFSTAIYEGQKFIEALGQCMVTIVKDAASDELPSAIDLMEMYQVDVRTAAEIQSAAATTPVSEDSPLEVIVEQPVEDDINWDDVAADLARGGMSIQGAVLRTALTAPSHPMSPASNAASVLGSTDLGVKLKYMDSGDKRSFLRAVILAAGRLGVHAHSTLVNEQLAVKQRSALMALNSLADTERPVLNWADEAAAEEAASAVLRESVGEAAMPVVPAARDDPDGGTMSVQDFGDGTSAQDSGGAVGPAANVEIRSLKAKVGFAPPIGSPS